MHQKLLFYFFLSCIASTVCSQPYKISGKVINLSMEPLSYVSIQIKGHDQGVVSNTDGSFELELDNGQYDLVVSLTGYLSRVIPLVVDKADQKINIILEEDRQKLLSNVVIRGKAKDYAEEIIRNVIKGKDAINSAPGSYSYSVYIKAVQEDSMSVRKHGKSSKAADSLKQKGNAELNRMAMAEIILRVDRESAIRQKENRLGVSNRGNADGLFFLSTTEGDFNFYQNLLQIPSVSAAPFLSPISYSGLVAYRFKTIKIEQSGKNKLYTIGIKPRQASNATVEGEVQISDSGWVLLHTRFQFPSYHLPEYDFFEVEQDYNVVNGSAWMITKQAFTYYTKKGRGRISGYTLAQFKDFELNKTFPRKHFGEEVSTTTQEAYDQDSLFWQKNRTTPLNEKELRFIRYKDSIYRVIQSTAWLDSMDRVINRITWKKILLSGQSFNDHKKQRHWYIPPLPNLFQPFQMGGSRISLSFFYNKTFTSRKNLSLYTDLSYGIRNRDVNGGVRLSRMYNPFNRGFYHISLGRSFDYIFQGDAWVNMLKRSNIYLNNALSVGHGLEIRNGLFLYTDIDLAFRKSVSHYKTNPKLDSLLGDFLDNNQAIAFEPYNAFYGKIRLQYTPFQRYIREPKEKIILGSAWPTFYTVWRKGIPGPINSMVDFDYLEFGMEQELKLGLVGISRYTVRSGSFFNKRDLRLVDYKFQRRGDPFFFLNPDAAFQALDSTFPLFRRFYEGHYVHEFNGALINRIPLLKQLRLREVGGAGFLLAPERGLRYAETFAGIERVFKWPFNMESKFKLGVYVVASVANQFRNPVQFKIGVTTWDRKRNKWF
jgi:hypothetical protein